MSVCVISCEFVYRCYLRNIQALSERNQQLTVGTPCPPSTFRVGKQQLSNAECNEGIPVVGTCAQTDNSLMLCHAGLLDH